MTRTHKFWHEKDDVSDDDPSFVEQEGKRVPRLAVVCTGGANLGRCYHASFYTIITTRELDDETFKMLVAQGYLGYGQEFSTRERNTKKKASEVDLLGDEYVTRKMHYGKPWTNDPDVYITRCERRVDSSD